jgi:hypothetical protein
MLKLLVNYCLNGKGEGRRKMKSKYLTLLLLVSLAFAMIPMLSIQQVYATHPEVVVYIDGKPSWIDKPYTLVGEKTCTNITVEIAVMNVQELFAYEVMLDWGYGYRENPVDSFKQDFNDPSLGTYPPLPTTLDYVDLVSYTYKSIWSKDFIVDQYLVEEPASPNRPYEYFQAATSLAESFNGTAPIANLVFHINKDVCYPFQVYIWFQIIYAKFVGPCGEVTEPSMEEGYLKLHPVQPTIKLVPRLDGADGWIELGPSSALPEDRRWKVVKWIYGSAFWVDVVVENVIALKSFHLDIDWGYYWQLKTDIQSVVITDFLPKPYEVFDVDVPVPGHSIHVDVVMPCYKTPVSGSGVIMSIKFVANDPWDRWWIDFDMDAKLDTGERGLAPPVYEQNNPANPQYNKDYPLHWIPKNCKDEIWISGYLDTMCNPFEEMWPIWNQEIGNPDYGPKDIQPVYYEFRPVPGDLDLNGKADVSDVKMVAFWYGLPSIVTPAMLGLNPATYLGQWILTPVDLNGDGVIDIEDIVIVSKWFCRDKPFGPVFP